MHHVFPSNQMAGGFHQIEHLADVTGPVRQNPCSCLGFTKADDPSRTINLEVTIPRRGQFTEMEFQLFKIQANQLTEAAESNAFVIACDNTQIVLNDSLLKCFDESLGRVSTSGRACTTETTKAWMALKLCLLVKGRRNDFFGGEKCERPLINGTKQLEVLQGLQTMNQVHLMVVILGHQQERDA